MQNILFANGKERFRLGRNVAIAIKTQIHDLDLVHQDIKPTNIAITGEGNDIANLIDLGFLTKVGQLNFMSTWQYSAPETMRYEVEMRFEKTEIKDCAADIELLDFPYRLYRKLPPKATKKLDVFSLAKIFVELFFIVSVDKVFKSIRETYPNICTALMNFYLGESKRSNFKTASLVFWFYLSQYNLIANNTFVFQHDNPDLGYTPQEKHLLIELINQMLKQNPEERPTIEEVIEKLEHIMSLETQPTSETCSTLSSAT